MAIMNELAVLAVVLLVSACTSAPAFLAPEIQIHELTGPGSLGYPTGALQIEYEMEIHNVAAEPITLRRIDVQSQNSPDSPYVLRHEAQTFDLRILPGETQRATFWVKAYGQVTSSHAHEPLSVRIIGFFDTPGGPIQKYLHREIG